jgi:hypothetical protein
MPSTETLPLGGNVDLVTRFLVLFPAQYIINIGDSAGLASAEFPVSARSQAGIMKNHLYIARVAKL